MGRPALLELLGPDSTDRDVGRWLGLFGAMFLLGAASGGVIFGWFGDRYGRVRTMIFSVLTYSLFTGAAYAAVEPWHLMALRFIASMGMGGQWSLGVALVVECWPGIARPALAGIIGAAANVGFLMISSLGYIFPVSPDSWRWIMLAGASPAVLVFLIALFVPESERWKAAVRRAQGLSGTRNLFGEPRLQDVDRDRSVSSRAVGHLGVRAMGTLLGRQESCAG